MTDDIIFGYQKLNSDTGKPAMSVKLYRKGKLLYSSGSADGKDARSAEYIVTDSCTRNILKLINRSAADLKRCAVKINEGEADFENENHYIFGSLRIIDWDISRWSIEEERKKQPEYCRNAEKVKLTKNYVRALFDEICFIIENDEKKLQHVKSFYNCL